MVLKWAIASVTAATVCGGFASQVLVAPLPMAVRRIFSHAATRTSSQLTPSPARDWSVQAKSGIKRPRSPPESIPSEHRVKRRASSRHQITAT
jgi:hypothetical protein